MTDEPRTVLGQAMDLFDVFGHPIRMRIIVLMAASGREWSPEQLANAFDERLGTVAYHVRTLAQVTYKGAGIRVQFLYEVRQERVRGAIRHVYRPTPPTVEVLRRLSVPTWGDPDSWSVCMTVAEALGYKVELVPYVECADMPGLLGAACGGINYGKRIIRIREGLSPAMRLDVLAHELEHAMRPDDGERIDRERHEELLARQERGQEVPVV